MSQKHPAVQGGFQKRNLNFSCVPFLLPGLQPGKKESPSSQQRQSCDHNQTCDEGFTCMTHGIFHCLPNEIPREWRMRPENETERQNCTPVCVRAPAPPGTKGSDCSADVDCTSGQCSYFPLGRADPAASPLSRLLGKCL